MCDACVYTCLYYIRVMCVIRYTYYMSARVSVFMVLQDTRMCVCVVHIIHIYELYVYVRWTGRAYGPLKRDTCC